ncbi:hypothetical protein [Mesorhizobium sp. INR15]|uniref:hypothetical protein n=1 Tax=Mesorhizobium sp. INR15 TaxID=2654248 RepID=UPI0018969FFE|nr:hypothetical protein [Mesorhizobium sp. INR15]
MANVEKVSATLAPETGSMVRELGRLWDVGMSSGDAVNGHAAFARIKGRLEARIAERQA